MGKSGRGERKLVSRARNTASTGSAANPEATFKRLVFELSLPRARQIVDDLERGLRTLIAG
jgi:hypothetical protein